MKLLGTLVLFACITSSQAQGSSLDTSFDDGWRFFRGDSPGGSGKVCTDKDFPTDLGDLRCLGLKSISSAGTADACQNACCGDDSCTTWQFCPEGAGCNPTGCWIGSDDRCKQGATNTTGWISRARPTAAPTPKVCNSDFCKPGFDDSSWRSLDVPHDWGIEDLPARDADTNAPVLDPRYGTWSFSKGDDPSWSKVDFDDSKWQKVQGGQDWRVHSNYTDKNAIGWYRQKVSANQLLQTASNVKLDLGIISGVDETYLNGVKIGSSGKWGAPGCRDYISWRAYSLKAGELKAEGNVIAVRIFTTGGKGTYNDGTYPGGFYDDPILKDKDVRKGAFDAGASLNGRSYGYTVGGVGWYRKTFTPSVYGGANVRVRFDGVYMNSDMYLNGHFLGNHPYGYTSFEYDLTKFLNPPGSNKPDVLAVRVNNYGRNSRWYSGSGIFRHTWLTVTPALHFQMWGLHLSTPTVALMSHAASASSFGATQQSQARASSATVRAEVTLVNSATTASKPTSVKVSLAGPDGSAAGTGTIAVGAIAAGATSTADVSITVSNPVLWSDQTPKLYTATATLAPPAAANSTDPQQPSAGETATSTFGVRSVLFDHQKGFLLNGVPTKFYGGCLHHDNGPLGSKAISRAEERRVQLLKANGYNAIRTSHNPVSPAFLDACDREGILVMDEAFDCWAQGKNTDDYHVWFNDWWQRDIESMVLRDRNHPSVVMWSIGNEIPMRMSPAGYNLSAVLSDYVRSLDSPHSGRAVTSAFPGVNDRADPFFKPLEIAGYNYSPQRYISDRQRIPDRLIVGTESFPKDSFQMWDLVWNNDFVLGDFIWTMFDYIGESDIGMESESGDVDQCSQEPFPWHISFCGDIDNAGHQKPQAYYRKVLWGASPIEIGVHIPRAPGTKEQVGGWGWIEERQSWTWDTPQWKAGMAASGGKLDVNVYAKGGKLHSIDNSTACSEVELTLNGKSLGKMKVGYSTQFTAAFQGVAFEAGTLTATCTATTAGASTDTILGASTSYTTAGAVASLKLVPDRTSIKASRDDLSFVNVLALDAKGNLVPDAAVKVTFAVGGAGEIAALGNGDPQDIDSVQGTERLTWRGKAVAILRPKIGAASGSITLKASADGLPDASTSITVGATD